MLPFSWTGLRLARPAGRGVGAVAFVPAEFDPLESRRLGTPDLRIDPFGRGQRHDLGVEAAGSLRLRRSVLARKGVSVLAISIHAVAGGDTLCGLDHRVVDARHHGAQIVVARMKSIGMLVLDQGDRFEASGDEDVGFPNHDPLRRDGDGLKAGGAHAADCQPGDVDRQAGAHRGLPGDVGARRTLGAPAAHDDVRDLRAIQRGTADRLRNHMAAERGSMRFVEGPLVGAADRGPRRGDDNGSTHGPGPPPREDDKRS